MVLLFLMQIRYLYLNVSEDRNNKCRNLRAIWNKGHLQRPALIKSFFLVRQKKLYSTEKAVRKFLYTVVKLFAYIGLKLFGLNIVSSLHSLPGPTPTQPLLLYHGIFKHL